MKLNLFIQSLYTSINFHLSSSSFKQYFISLKTSNPLKVGLLSLIKNFTIEVMCVSLVINYSVPKYISTLVYQMQHVPIERPDKYLGSCRLPALIQRNNGNKIDSNRNLTVYWFLCNGRGLKAVKAYDCGHGHRGACLSGAEVTRLTTSGHFSVDCLMQRTTAV